MLEYLEAAFTTILAIVSVGIGFALAVKIFMYINKD